MVKELHLPSWRAREPKAPAKQFSWLQKLRTATLHGLAVIGLAYLTSALHQHIGVLPKQLRNEHLKDDVYPDTDYPLRPATEHWDISTSYPYPRSLSTTVTEGTWLRIATHPREPEIVFDMLGDLYCMSTNNASGHQTAHPILTGVPYEREAEFSHDGKHMVFISDAGYGVDNIWTMPYTTCQNMAKRPQEDVRQSTIQQTNATLRFFSSPAFHPSGDKIIATKWFLTGRPNGAGEIWEFPVSKDQTQNLPEVGGRRLVARKLPAYWGADRYPESQLGSEQARYTHTGDAVIFSRNVKDDGVGKFSYNKDIHAGINAVFQLNVTSGETTELVAATASEPNKPASPGGANMPRLSHDGQTLAFIRRRDEKEVLALKNMRSGTVHYAWEELSYDLSTIPAFMGAYPNYGWTSDDSAIIIWSQGQIWKVELDLNTLGERQASGHPALLPFKADIELSLGKTVYAETKIKKAEIAEHGEVRALRGLRSDVSGIQVTFEAAGDNFVFNVQTQSQTAVAKPNESTSCYAPSFVTGTQFVLQACWYNQNLTSFHVVDHDKQSFLEGLPRGRYISPVSNGQHIAYVRTGKDYMFGDIEETFGEGIWIGSIQIMNAAGQLSPSVDNLRRIPNLAFSTDTKLDFAIHGGRAQLLVQNPASVTRYDLETGATEQIIRGKTSVEMAVAGPTVAFRDFQHIWLSEQAREMQPAIWSKPGDSQTPKDAMRLSKIGGHDVTLSGDGEKVFWLLGPTLHVADVRPVVDACRRASLEVRDSGDCASKFVSSHTMNASFETALGQQKRISGGKTFAVVNASLVAMSDDLPELERQATVLISKGEVIAAGPGYAIQIPEGSEVLDAEGGVVLPGFVDVHAHWGGFISPYPAQSWEMETFLGYGVTTIHNPASKNVAGYVERALIEKGRMYGPRVFHTGDVLYGSIQPPVYTEIRSRADARDALLRVKSEGGDAAFSVKNYQLTARSARQRLLLEAADLEILVVPEGGWSFDWGLTYFIDGYTSQEHPLPIPELYEDVLSLVAASGSSYTPLAVMNYGGIFGQHWIHQTFDIPNNEKLRKYVKHDILESLTEVKQAPQSSYLFFNTTRSTAKLAKRGVRTNIGSHGEQPIGFLYHGEMLMMGLGGQSPYEILRHATIDGATSLGLNASVGSVEEGKLADLVIYPPGVDSIEKVWEASMDMKYVMRGGTLFSVEDGLVEEWPRQGRRQVLPRLNAEYD